MKKNKRTCNTRILDSFAGRIQILSDTINAKSTDGLKLLTTLKTLLIIKSLSRIVIRDFIHNWQSNECDIDKSDECSKVLELAVSLKEQLVDAHSKLSTLPSPLARWAGRRLIGPVLDWNDLVLDLSIASDQEIQNSLAELEEVI